MVKVRKGKQNRGNRKPSVKAREASSESLKGNGFWKLRTKHGREALFESPLTLLKEAQNYITLVEENPLYKSEWREGGLVDIPVKRVVTLTGFCCYLDVELSWWRGFKLTKAFEKDKGFGTVMEKIENSFYSQKFEGAASGFFNASIIARDLGLVDKQDVTSAGEKLQAPEFKVYNNAPPLASDEKSVDNKKKK